MAILGFWGLPAEKTVLFFGREAPIFHFRGKWESALIFSRENQGARWFGAKGAQTLEPVIFKNFKNVGLLPAIFFQN